MKIYTVNSFTFNDVGGNKAGVAVCESLPAKEDMQRIAKDVGFSETVFICQWRDGYLCRFFTPKHEVNLCGHATIAAFFVLAKIGMITARKDEAVVKQYTIQERLEVKVLFKRGEPFEVFMCQPRPESKGPLEKKVLDRLCATLCLDRKHIGIKEEMDFSPEIINSGLSDIILPVVSKGALFSITPDNYELASISEELSVIGVHAFTIDTILSGSSVHCRNFAPAAGIDEESATGTSNGALGYYLANKGLIREDEVICEQGFCMGSPSLIHVKINENGIQVGGRAFQMQEIRRV